MTNCQAPYLARAPEEALGRLIADSALGRFTIDSGDLVADAHLRSRRG